MQSTGSHSSRSMVAYRVGAGCAALVLAACLAKHNTAASRTGSAEPTLVSETTTPDGHIEQELDLNGDGRADIINEYVKPEDGPRRLVKTEADLNWDGQVDVHTVFDDSGAIKKEEIDSDFDGQVDWVDHYQAGKRVLSEIDTNEDGRFDLFRIYEGGMVRRKERDTDGDGQVDFWEYLDQAGNIVKVGRDMDGDGIMDVRQD